MNGPAPSRTALIAAFATIYLVWGSTYLGIRIAVETIPPFLLSGVRFAIAGTLIFTFLKLKGAAWPNARQWRNQAVVGVFLLLGGNAVVSWCELRVPSGITALILGAAPLVVVFMDWIRPGGRRPTAGLLVGVAVGIGGVAMLLGPGSIPAGYRPPLLDIVALFASSVCWWIGSLYSKHGRVGTPLLMASAMQMLCGSASILVVALLVGEGRGLSLSAISPHSWMAFAYLIVVGSIVVFPVYTWLLEHSTPTLVSTYAYVNPVVAVFLGWVVLNEPLNARILVAAAIIIGAVAIITIGRSKAAAGP